MVGGYVRVSRVGGRSGEKFLSPTLQRERIAGWCTTHGHTLSVVVEDLDVSGGATDRDRLEALVERIERGDLGGLVVATLDRFGRSLPYAIALIDRIDRAGGQFVSVSDGFDTRTPYGRLALNVMLSVAQFELERVRAQWQTIVHRQIADGRHPGPTPPFGYERGPDGRLAPDRAAPLVAELFERVAAGESISPIARDWNTRAITTQRGGQITRRLLSSILTNRAYLGEARAGALVNPGAHPPLVDERTWRAVQSGTRPRPGRTGGRALLAGLVRCQGCRYAMAPVMRLGKRRYRCLGNQQGRKCPAPAFVTEEEIAPLVEGMLWRRLGQIVAEAAGDLEKIDDLRVQREVDERELVAFRDEPGVIEALGPRDYADGLAVRRAKLEATDHALSAALAARPVNLPDATTLRAMWPKMDDETRNGFLLDVFDAVVVRKHPSRSERLAIVDRVRAVARGRLADLGDIPRAHRGYRPIVAFEWASDPSGAWILPG